MARRPRYSSEFKTQAVRMVLEDGRKVREVADQLVLSPDTLKNGAVLCHISVSKWCYANKEEATSKKRSERCGRLTADACAKAVEILNAKIDAGKDYKAMLAKQESVKYCSECHQTKGQETNWGKGILNCTPCHDGRQALADKFKNHP
ncbi:MAG: hypothetical protein E7022_09915 [Desulfovibrio desulfuricans]|nr:hypothetical protein [Desulfovibrio desulfuricans]